MSKVDVPTGGPSYCQLSRCLFSLSARRGTGTTGSDNSNNNNNSNNSNNNIINNKRETSSAYLAPVLLVPDPSPVDCTTATSSYGFGT
jgi:hypothetical protein